MYKKALIPALIFSGITAIIMLFFVFNPSENHYFLKCPFKYMTGYDCVGCGSQRAIHQLLHGNIITAFKFNPLLIISFPLVAYALGLKVYNYLFNTTYRVSLFYKNWFLYGIFGIAVLFWIFRNTDSYPL